MVAAAAALVFAGQAFAMAGGQAGGTHSMNASMSQGSAGRMQQGPASGAGNKLGTMAGSRPQSMGHGGVGNGAGLQQGAKPGNGAGLQNQ